MEAITVKEKILKNIREALIYKDDLKSLENEIEIIPNIDNDKSLNEIFAEKYIEKGGNYFFCDEPNVLIDGLKKYFSIIKNQNIICKDETLCDILSFCKIDFNKQFIQNEDYQYFVMPCTALIADNGNILINLDFEYEKFIHTSFSNLIIIALTSQVFPNLIETMKFVKKENNISNIVQIIQNPNSTNLIDFPNNTTLFLRHVIVE